jgi:hypothetical protein
MSIRNTPNLADMFARFWHELTKDEGGDHRIMADSGALRDQVLECAERLDRILATEGNDSLASLDNWVLTATIPASPLLRKLLVAQSIDRWYGQLFPEEDMSPPNDNSRKNALRMLGKLGRFNTEVQLGQVIPKRPRWGRFHDYDVEGFRDLSDADWFSALKVVPLEIPASDPDDSVKRRKIQLNYRFLEPHRLRATEADQLVVGIAPVAELKNDISLKLRNSRGRHWYDAIAKNLGRRADEAVKALCKAGANIIVFPEMTMSPIALNAVEKAIARYGPTSSLRLVVAGTSRRARHRNAPYNEALIYTIRGKPIGTQRKLHRWNLNLHQRERIGLNVKGLDEQAKLFEFITPGDEMVVFEIPIFGRIAVLICEDLGRIQPAKWLLKNMYLDWVFTPILDTSIMTDRWMGKHGRKAARLGRSRVVVVNSLPLTLRQNEAILAQTQTCGVGLCIDLTRGKVRHHLSVISLEDVENRWRVVKWDPDRWMARGARSRRSGP